MIVRALVLEVARDLKESIAIRSIDFCAILQIFGR